MESVESKKKETNSDKVCNCTKTECLKLYCGCFASGVYCEEGRCACKGCFNKQEYEEYVEKARKRIEQRDPLAFAPPIVNPLDDSPNINGDGNSTNTSSARYKKGCKCKSSKCLMKYCECCRAKVGCSDRCGCKDCDNSFGKKSETMLQRTKLSDTNPLTVSTHPPSPKQPCSSEEESSVLGMMEDASDDVDTDYVMSDWCPFLFDDVLDKTGDGDVPDSVMEDSNPTNTTECESPDQPTATSSSCPPTPATCCNSEDRMNQTGTDRQGGNHDN